MLLIIVSIILRVLKQTYLRINLFRPNFKVSFRY